MNVIEYLKENILCLDGAMGTLLQERGLAVGELPETWNITHPETVEEIHLSYFDAGSNVVSTNTFGANAIKFSECELDKIVSSAIRLARGAMEKSSSPGPKWVALDIGPLGKMLHPYGELDFEEAIEIFSKTVRLGVKYGADLIIIETMNDSYETKAAVLAAKENSSLPVFVMNAYSESSRLMTGASPLSMVAMLEGLGVSAIGVNCSLGPKALAPVSREYLKYSSLPVILKPNAGLPTLEGDRTVFDISAESFAEEVAELVSEGVRIVGGCCGTTPDYIRCTLEKIKGIRPKKTEKKDYTVVSSYTNAVVFGDSPVLIGERINPTGKKKLKEALRASDMEYILREGISEEELGAHILDVNVGLPDIDEPSMLTRVVKELQAVIDLPLQIDTSDPEAMGAALRIYNGKPMINSVNGKRESMEQVFPLAKKYGGVIVALTLDENGIPERAEGRVEIAKRILKQAEKYGINKKDIIFDPLALTVSADKTAAAETLRAIRKISEELHAKTSLGVSNVSFGLPGRDIINSTFFSMALSFGLSAAIMNPHSPEMMKTYYAYRVLRGLDDNCKDYIDFAGCFSAEQSSSASVSTKMNKDGEACGTLGDAIVKGLSERAADLTRELIKTVPSLDIIEKQIIPALDTVGIGYEAGRVYLPSLLMSAESAKAAFSVIKDNMTNMSQNADGDKCKIVLATVKGDIHDIGKNIVKLLLENYGFRVIDLGRDVPPQTVLDAVRESGASIVGLSALMTTTLGAMEQTIELLRECSPSINIVVGGAVLTEAYAEKIGADKYAHDAMETVRYAEYVNNNLKK